MPSVALTSRPSPTVTTAATPPAWVSTITELHLRLKNAKGEPVSFSKAELFAEAWGLYDSLALTTEQDLLVLPLDDALVAPHFRQPIGLDWHDYILYIEAAGYAPVQSEPFYLRGQTPDSEPVTQVSIQFPVNVTTTASQGKTEEFELTLHESVPRRLRFVDDNLEPVPGVKVQTYMFWSDENHCGWVIHSPLLAEAVSDDEGWVMVPDGDFRYFLSLAKPRYHIAAFTYPIPASEGSAIGSMTLAAFLPAPETTITLHRLRRQPLEMVVERDRQPAANENLCAESVDTTCNYLDFCDPIATTDQNGHILIEDFYPEQWDAIFFMGKEGVLWQMDPTILVGGEVVRVELPGLPSFARPVGLHSVPSRLAPR